jgi:lysyl-tRNA synthetase, class II
VTLLKLHLSQVRPHTKARLLGLTVAAAGLVTVLSALTPELRLRLDIAHEAFTPAATHLASGATALLGLALLLLGRGIAGRRRFAYMAAVAVLVASAMTHVVKGLDLEESLISLGVAALLLRSRALFTAPMPRARWYRLARAVPVVIAVCFAYGVIGLELRRSSITPTPTIGLALKEVAYNLVGMAGPLRISGGFGQWFPVSIGILGGAALFCLFMAALAPVAEHVLASSPEREQIRRLVCRRDGDTLDPFALRRDKSYVLSGDGRAAVAYRYLNGVGLASGDPVGDPRAARDALARFIALCELRGWRPAVLGARGDHLAIYEDLGFRTRYLGDEAIIDVESFTLEGRAMRPVRQAANRTKNFGILTEIHLEGELDATLRRALVGIAERHREGAPERGFSMALDGLLAGRDRDKVIVVARDKDGTPIAFQRYVPCLDGAGLSLDAMRRDQIGPNGVNERMIVDVVEWARARDISVVSLNFAAFKGLIEEGADLSPAETAQAWVLKRLSPYFQIESLLTFNAKFRPRWVPRYLAYRSPGHLATVGIAALSAEAFLPFDRRARRRADTAAAEAVAESSAGAEEVVTNA